MEVKYIHNDLEGNMSQILIYPFDDKWTPKGEWAPSLGAALTLIFKEIINEDKPFITYIKQNDTIIKEWGLYPYEYDDNFDVIRIIGERRSLLEKL